MRKIYFSLLALCFSPIASADPVSIGAAFGWEKTPYTQYKKNHYYPVPHINYDNEHWYIEDTTVGVYFYNQNQQNITLSLNYLSNEFRAKDSRSAQMSQLSNRHSTVLAVLEYAIDTRFGSFSTNVGHDILNQSKSTIINLDYSAPIVGDRWIILSTLGVSWTDRKHNNYYYGISHNEANHSGLPYYNARSSFIPYLEIKGQYALTKHINLFSGLKFERLTGDAANSPMISHKTIPSAYAGLFYAF